MEARIVIQRERQRERAALMSPMLEVGGMVVEELLGVWGWAGVGGGKGVDAPDVLGERGRRESGKCVICVWAET